MENVWRWVYGGQKRDDLSVGRGDSREFGVFDL